MKNKFGQEQYYLIITIILEKGYRKHISSLTTDFVGVSSLQKRSSSDQAEQKPAQAHEALLA
jgi:hypothetical protein